MFPGMSDPDYARPQAVGGTRGASGRRLRPALMVTGVGAIVFSGSMFALLHEPMSTTTAEFTAVVALAAFGVTVYGLLRTVLILIESAGERRREERAATERRTGDRASKPG